jgi:hypothetical protein
MFKGQQLTLGNVPRFLIVPLKRLLALSRYAKRVTIGGQQSFRVLHVQASLPHTMNLRFLRSDQRFGYADDLLTVVQVLAVFTHVYGMVEQTARSLTND